MEQPEIAIQTLLGRLCALIEVRVGEMPTDEQKARYTSGIARYLKNRTLTDIYRACEMNEYGQFETRVPHYGRLEMSYITACLTLYDQKLRNERMAEAKKAQPKVIWVEHDSRSLWFGMIDYFKTNGEPPESWNWNGAYDYLRDSGMLDQSGYDLDRLKKIYAEELENYNREKDLKTKFAQNLHEYRAAMAEDGITIVKLNCRRRVCIEILTQ